MDLTVHLSPESLRRLDYFARNWGYSRSEAVSILFHHGLNAFGGVDAHSGGRVLPRRPPDPTASAKYEYQCPQCGSSRLEKRGTDYLCLDCQDHQAANAA